MSAIQSLLRVMILRDAEAIILEADKVPSLRRRGQIEALAMPALDPKLLADFAGPLVEGRGVEDWPAIVPFRDPDGAAYQCTIDKVPAGLRVVARPARTPAVPAATAATSPAAPAPAAPAERPRAWWAQPSTRATTPAAPAPSPAAATTAAPATRAPVAASDDHEATRAEGIARLAELLGAAVAQAYERAASDVLLSTGQAPRIRLDGRVEPLDLAIDDAELAACVGALGSNTDHSLEISGIRVRVHLFDHLAGAGIAARLIRDRVPSLGDLGLPPEVASVIEHRDGLVLVGGPTGSGKSTTLAALVDLIDQRRAAHIVTIEDPIEYRFAGRRCLIHQRELGTHVPSFAAGLRAALREAPDVILLGELRDRETIAAALTAAETGHLVLATLHAPNAAGAIDRIIDAFPDVQQRQVRWQLAAVLRSVTTQFLLPRRDGGRALALEHVPTTAAVANLVRKGELHMLPTAIQSGRDAGMMPLERSLARLLDSGTVSPQVVRRIATDHDLLAALSSKLR
ncbi:MAG: type IV pilus twitching motility protein PilT [Kofleriaceae bacterium]